MEKQCPRCGHQFDPEAVPGLKEGCPRCMAAYLRSEGRGLSSFDSAAGGADDETPPLAVGQKLRGFEVLEYLGRGGMGFVYKAKQTGLDRVVALKVLAPRLASSPEFAARFEREAKALAALRHPNIVDVHDYGQENGLYFLVMEYVDGTSLRRVLSTQKLEAETALRYVPQICDALEYAHSQGVIHRDIKPENILLDKHGQLKIADFGLAKMASASPGTAGPGFAEPGRHATVSGRVLGTPHYMAPEQVEDMSGVDHRADIYSLGVVFYEMLTGELPLGRFPAPSQRVAVDVRFDEVVLKALEREPEKRYQRASYMKEDVTRVATSSHASAPISGSPRTAAWASVMSNAAKAARWSFGALLAAAGMAGVSIAAEISRSSSEALAFVEALCGFGALAGLLLSFVIGRLALRLRSARGERLLGWPYVQAALTPTLVSVGILVALFFVLPAISFFALEDRFLDGGTVFLGEVYRGTDLYLWTSFGALGFACISLSSFVLVRFWPGLPRVMLAPLLDRLREQHARMMMPAVALGVLLCAGSLGLFFKTRPKDTVMKVEVDGAGRIRLNGAVVTRAELFEVVRKNSHRGLHYGAPLLDVWHADGEFASQTALRVMAEVIDGMDPTAEGTARFGGVHLRFQGGDTWSYDWVQESVSGPAIGAVKPTVSWGRPVNGLQAGLTVESAKIETGNPIVVSVSLRNLTAATVLFDAHKPATTWRFRFERVSDGKLASEVQPGRLTEVSPLSGSLGTGASWALFGLVEPKLPPGDYRLTGSCRIGEGPQGAVLTGPVAVEIVEVGETVQDGLPSEGKKPSAFLLSDWRAYDALADEVGKSDDREVKDSLPELKWVRDHSTESLLGSPVSNMDLSDATGRKYQVVLLKRPAMALPGEDFMLVYLRNPQGRIVAWRSQWLYNRLGQLGCKLLDANGDGQKELCFVSSMNDKGQLLAAYGIRDGKFIDVIARKYEGFTVEFVNSRLDNGLEIHPLLAGRYGWQTGKLYEIPVRISNRSGEPIDLTGCSVWLSEKLPCDGRYGAIDKESLEAGGSLETTITVRFTRGIPDGKIGFVIEKQRPDPTKGR